MIRTVVVALVAAIIVIALALAARAQTPFAMILPPIEYDKPYTGDHLMIRIAKDQKQVAEWCNYFIPRVACSRVRRDHNWCEIIKLSDKALIEMGWNPLHVMRHEHAHCRGWIGHDDARTASAAEDAKWMNRYDWRELYAVRDITAVRSGSSPSAAASSPGDGR
jgi:hypothetical protein